MTHELSVSDFNIGHTLESAQPLTFLGDMRKDGNGVAYAYRSNLVEVEQRGERLLYSTYGSLGAAQIGREIAARFRLDDDMGKIYGAIGTDAFIKSAIRSYRGMRITRNDPWETTLCFLVSQFNNVKRIRGIVQRLILAYGPEHKVGSGNVRLSFRSFPSAQTIAQQSVRDLMKHGAGFRARYIKEAARQCADGFDLGELSRKDYAEAKEALMDLPGIGDKVADCILLFGYGRLEAFPVDTWVKRVVEKVYFDGKKKSARDIRKFAEERWGACAGYAQQYLFHAARVNRLRVS